MSYIKANQTTDSEYISADHPRISSEITLMEAELRLASRE